MFLKILCNYCLTWLFWSINNSKNNCHFPNFETFFPFFKFFEICISRLKNNLKLYPSLKKYTKILLNFFNITLAQS